MAHILSVVSLRLVLGVLRAVQPRLPAGPAGAVAHAARLRLDAGEQRSEAAIDALRQRLVGSDETVEVVDYGAGPERGGGPLRYISSMYKRAATGPAWGRFLFGLVRARRPQRVLELGTNLGVGAAHLAQALCLNEEEDGERGRLVTLEGDPGLATRAAGALARLGHPVGEGPDDRVRVVIGPFADTLAPTAQAEGPFDLVFVDGHHTEAAALDYLATLDPHLAPDALVVLDDVEPGRPVRQAWRRYRAGRPAAPAFYAGKYGLVFTGPAPPEGAATPLGRQTTPPSPGD